MSAFALKIIAIITMLIDHAGAVFVFFPSYFRAIGRISFPIFAFLVSEGCTHSKNLKRYLLRLGIFALISEIPYDLAFNQSSIVYKKAPLKISFLDSTNIYYTLFFAVAVIVIYKNLLYRKNKILLLLFGLLPMLAVFFSTNYYNTTNVILVKLAFVIYTFIMLIISLFLKDDFKGEARIEDKILSSALAFPIIFLGNILSTDYGVFGIAWIITLALVNTRTLKLFVLLFGVINLYGLPLLEDVKFIGGNVIVLIYALISVALIYFYNGKRGPKIKWAFYWFYPIHISVMAFIWILFIRPI